MKFKLVLGNQKRQIRLQIDFFWSLVIMQFTAINGTWKKKTQTKGKECLMKEFSRFRSSATYRMSHIESNANRQIKKPLGLIT